MDLLRFARQVIHQKILAQRVRRREIRLSAAHLRNSLREVHQRRVACQHDCAPQKVRPRMRRGATFPGDADLEGEARCGHGAVAAAIPADARSRTYGPQNSGASRAAFYVHLNFGGNEAALRIPMGSFQ
jgi:hypothetical protein